jgi:hypothetical protein
MSENDSVKKAIELLKRIKHQSVDVESEGHKVQVRAPGSSQPRDRCRLHRRAQRSLRRREVMTGAGGARSVTVQGGRCGCQIRRPQSLATTRSIMSDLHTQYPETGVMQVV